ncbi:MAG: hypothetical protein ACRC2R_01035 [Xenococcaceae cyanobacterium]
MGLAKGLDFDAFLLVSDRHVLNRLHYRHLRIYGCDGMISNQRFLH